MNPPTNADIRWKQRFQNFDRAFLLLREIWIDMLNRRNLLSHTYDPAAFEKAVEAIAEHYLAALSEVRGHLADRARA